MIMLGERPTSDLKYVNDVVLTAQLTKGTPEVVNRVNSACQECNPKQMRKSKRHIRAMPQDERLQLKIAESCKLLKILEEFHRTLLGDAAKIM